MSGGKSYKCGVCNATFTRKYGLKQHEMRHSAVFGFHCKLCSKKFKTTKDYRLHLSRHSVKGRPFKCTRCDARYRDKCELIRHTKYIHDPSSNNRYKCIFCKQKFPGLKAIYVHLRSHIKERVYLCRLCPNEFASNITLKRHSETHKQESATRFPCNLCSETFSTKSNANAHILRIHTHERSIKCEVCNKHFVTSSDLKKHMVAHSNQRPFKCNECEKAFKSASMLKLHGAVHLTERNHPCPICMKRFARKQDMKAHIPTHTAEKSFKCEVCRKCFRTNSTRSRHMRVHTKEKPYSCGVCQKKFSYAAGIKGHYRRFHTAKPVGD